MKTSSKSKEEKKKSNKKLKLHLIHSVFEEYDERETKIHPFKVIDDFRVQKFTKDGSFKIVFLKFTENFIFYSKVE